MTSPAQEFIDQSARLLEDDYVPRVRRALDALPSDDLWWRPNDASNSAGNLVLHLAGNLRQWVVSGVGDAPDRRDRDGEFAADGVARDEDGEGAGMDVDEVLARLEAAVADALDVIRSLEPGRLTDPISVQGNETTVLRAVYHAVEHFSMHTGQLLWIAKARAGRDLGLYGAGEDGHPRKLW